ncbi:unnamed protein product [Bemisia tabaci]|uniref:Uncharacterized protein n=1 Tax=Bemisia tabaci TaxID=7038 RepID=A0A9P0AKM2_BEMTA|nr:unnamed protein product [Bemisia tabaci]
MEADMVVQASKDSEESHGLRYKILIPDPDSTAYSRTVEEVPYGREVIKRDFRTAMKDVMPASQGKRPSAESEKEVGREKRRRKVKKVPSSEAEDSESVAEATEQPTKVRIIAGKNYEYNVPDLRPGFSGAAALTSEQLAGRSRIGRESPGPARFGRRRGSCPVLARDST